MSLKKVYHKMATESKVVVRYRGNELNLFVYGIRVSIGTYNKTNKWLKNLKNMESYCHQNSYIMC